VVLTAGEQELLLGECLRLGADAVVGDGMPFDRLVETLLTLVRGGSVLASAERRAVIAATTEHLSGSEDRARRFSTLTPREAEVLEALVEGHSPKGIALAAGISISTVRGHIQRVLSKLDVSSQREAFAMARRAGWPHAHAA
jgi:DNA-binding NarL/FixJ family response regulator